MAEWGCCEIFWLFAVVQGTGWVCACLARLTEGSARQASFQWAFFGSLLLVGTATALAVGPGSFLTSGATLSGMVLTATWDLRGASPV